jgi:Sulfotransferase family
MSNQILIIGTPRSGTTWVFDVLASAAGVTAVLEPDNEKVSFLGRAFKGHLPRYPTLQPGQEDAAYLSLWLQAMNSPLASWLGTNRLLRSLEGFVFKGESLVEKKEQAALAKFKAEPRQIEMIPALENGVSVARSTSRSHRIAKSVHAVFAAEWLAEKLRCNHIMLVQRMPHGILSSMKKLAMADAVRIGSLAPHVSADELATLEQASSSPENYLAAAALQLAKMYAWMAALARRHTDWVLVKHEELCQNPVEQYRALFDRVDLPWSDKIEAGIRERDRPGEGFATVRKASDQIGKWKKSLSAAEIAMIDQTFARHGLEQWTSEATVACAT